jgi:hypothetical protein
MTKLIAALMSSDAKQPRRFEKNKNILSELVGRLIVPVASRHRPRACSVRMCSHLLKGLKRGNSPPSFTAYLFEI